MERPDQNPPDQPEQGPEITCAQATGLIDRMASGGLPGAIAAVLRAHLGVCPPCKADYRARMEALAALGRQVRANHGAGLGAVARGIGSSHHRPRLGGKALRRFAMFVVPAALFFFATRLSADWSFQPPLVAHWVEGTSWIGGRALDGDSKQIKLVRSDLVEPDPGASCRIEARDFEVQVESGARLLVISAVARRLRLEDGGVRVSGSVTLETPLGLVELDDGQAEVSLDGRGLEVLAREGSVELIDASGRRRLPLVEGDALVGL